MTLLRIILALAFVTVSGNAWAQQFRCSSAAVSPYPALVTTDLDHSRHAPRPGSLGKMFTAFAASFDTEDDDDADGAADFRLNPEYVAYELRGVGPSVTGNYAEPSLSIDRPSKWYTSPELVPLVDRVAGATDRRLDNSYSGAGAVWNRGHLAMSDHAQRISAEASCNTHHFWNASPQASDLNQGPWQHLENYTAAPSNKYRSVWVIAGPIFDRTTPKLTIGDPGELAIEIPDAFFKIIVHESPSGIDTLAFIFDQPNTLDTAGQPRPTATWVNCNRAKALGHVYDHRPQLSSIQEIERRTGLRFFPDHADRDAIIAARAIALWSVESRFWDDGAVCADQRAHP